LDYYKGMTGKLILDDIGIVRMRRVTVGVKIPQGENLWHAHAIAETTQAFKS